MKTFPKNKALEGFEPFIGAWNTVGSHGQIPGVTLHGRTTFRWHDSGAFVVMQSSIEEKVGIPEGLAIFGSDDEAGTCVMVYYDERGVSRQYQVSIKDRVLRWSRESPKLAQRYTLTLSSEGNRIEGKGEASKAGAGWEKDLDLDYAKAGDP